MTSLEEVERFLRETDTRLTVQWSPLQPTWYARIEAPDDPTISVEETATGGMGLTELLYLVIKKWNDTDRDQPF